MEGPGCGPDIAVDVAAECADDWGWTDDVDNSDDHRDRNLETLRADSGVRFLQPS